MKITFFIGGMGLGGAERVISHLANHFCNIGWSVDIVVLLYNKVEYSLNDRIKIVDLHGRYNSYYINSLYWLYKIRQYLRANNPDRVISFIGRINALVLFASIGLKKSVIVSERNDPKNDGRSKIMLQICNLLYKRASAVIFQTEYQRSCFSESVIQKSYIIPNPVAVNCKSVPHEKNRIVTVGRLTPQKNQMLFIDVAYKLKSSFPDLKFEIYGDGTMRDELNAKIDKLNLNTTVKLMGNKTNIHECIKSATIFVLTSLYEGASNALIEALMLGLPCICTDYPGADELIQNDINGIIVPQNNPSALAKKIEILLNNDLLRQRLGDGAKKSSKKYLLDSVMQQWEEIIASFPSALLT